MGQKTNRGQQWTQAVTMYGRIAPIPVDSCPAQSSEDGEIEGEIMNQHTATNISDHKVSDHYDANYGNFQTELYAEIRREAFGKDIGQSSWITASEQDRALDSLLLGPGKIVLDVACGSGGPALRMAEKSGCSVVGIDIHEQAISTAQSLAMQRKLAARAEFRRVNAGEALPFADFTFDAITCIDAINHLPDRRRLISDWARVLKTGGRLLFTNPTTITGPLSAEEIAIRSSIGFFLFVPLGYDERVIAECGMRLISRDDVTENMALLAERRGAAREARSEALRRIEGEASFEAQQKFFTIAARIAQERRLSRFQYVSERSE